MHILEISLLTQLGGFAPVVYYIDVKSIYVSPGVEWKEVHLTYCYRNCEYMYVYFEVYCKFQISYAEH